MYGLALVVFIGGAMGAMVREFIMLATPPLADGFPLDILIANIVASFLLGLATAHHRLKNISDELILLFGVGAMGGMSTFSSFAYGAVSELMKPGGLIIAIVYMLSSLLLGFLAVWLGLQLAKEIKQ